MDAEISESDRRQWEAEFEAASKRPLAERFKYAFIKTYKPVLDDAPYRSFESMAEYVSTSLSLCTLANCFAPALRQSLRKQQDVIRLAALISSAADWRCSVSVGFRVLFHLATEESPTRY